MKDMTSELDEAFVSFEDTKAELEAVEQELARRLGLGRRRDIRTAIIALDRQGRLTEDELVAEWHDLYASFLDWTREESWGLSIPK